jgi:hypothetical protein
MQPNLLLALLLAFAFSLLLASLPFHFALPCLSLPAVSLGCGTRCIENELPLAMQGAPLIRYCHSNNTTEAMVAWESTQSLVFYSSNTLSPAIGSPPFSVGWAGAQLLSCWACKPNLRSG